MKKFILNIATTFLLSISLNAQIVNVPDANFKNKLLQANATNFIAANSSGVYFKIDANNDGEIQNSEAQNVRILNVEGSNISSLEGILSFSNIRTINCYTNNLSSLNLQGLTSLEFLKFDNNQVSSVNLTGLVFLKYIQCTNNQLSNINLSSLISLYSLECNSNLLTSLNTNGLTQLNWVTCNNNLIQNLNFYTNTSLYHLECTNNQLQSLNVSNLNNLNSIDCSYNQLVSLDVSNDYNLWFLYCTNNQINSLVFDNCNTLNSIYCSNNLLTAIPLNSLQSSYIVLNCSFNQLEFLSIEGTGVYDLTCNNNLLTELIIKNGHLEDYLNFSGNPSLLHVCADEIEITTIQTLVNAYGYTNCVVDSSCVLKTEAFLSERLFLVYPNPGNDVINISNFSGATITAICIYNTLGQLVQEVSKTNSFQNINVSNLESGNYFMKITLKDRIDTIKFSKN